DCDPDRRTVFLPFLKNRSRRLPENSDTLGPPPAVEKLVERRLARLLRLVRGVRLNSHLRLGLLLRPHHPRALRVGRRGPGEQGQDGDHRSSSHLRHRLPSWDAHPSHAYVRGTCMRNAGTHWSVARFKFTSPSRQAESVRHPNTPVEYPRRPTATVTLAVI